MSEISENADWQDFSEFSGVQLTSSFALSWHLEAEMLVIDVDVELTPEHPFYEKPRPSERVCIRAAVIEFPFCERVSESSTPDGSIADVVERLGHGAIHGLKQLAENRYELSGKFGNVLIDAERPLLRLRA